MSAFDNSIPEPKQFFLNLLIKLDFEVASSLYRYNNYGDSINGIGQILALICSDDHPELKQMTEKINSYLIQSSAPIDELRPIFKDLQKYLTKTWFSELRLGMLPTGALPTDRDRPSHKALDPNQSSRI